MFAACVAEKQAVLVVRQRGQEDILVCAMRVFNTLRKIKYEVQDLMSNQRAASFLFVQSFVMHSENMYESITMGQILD